MWFYSLTCALAARGELAAQARHLQRCTPHCTWPLPPTGFDPLRLGTNPDQLKWYREGELTNGRWAMAAVAGILFTDLVGLPKFWLAGAEVMSWPVSAPPPWHTLCPWLPNTCI